MVTLADVDTASVAWRRQGQWLSPAIRAASNAGFHRNVGLV